MGLDIHDSKRLREIRDVVVEQPTLRDQFAVAALTGIVSTLALNDTSTGEVKDSAQLAYEFADAMLAAREEK